MTSRNTDFRATIMSHNHNIILLRNVVIDAYEYVGQFGNAIERNN